MYCPRLRHYARLNSSGKIGCCGHMVNAQQFPTYNEMVNSDWLKTLQTKMDKEQWPKECVRCEQTEQLNNTSIRLNSIQRDKILSKFDKDYIQLGGTLDNYCNSACVSCNPNLSTRIGNLKKALVIKDNYDLYKTLPLENIVELDINGGEPSISENYNNLLDNLPVNVKIIRINTNANVKIKQLKSLLDKGITVIITVSFDGIDKVHEYIRYPIKWKIFENNLMYYKDTSQDYKNMKLDTWTTVSCLNVGELNKIQTYCETHNIRHEFAFLNTPNPLNVKYKNWFTKDLNLQGVAIEKDNTKELSAFLQLEEACRPGIKRFWI
jgi:molybdenum cofactor biosynthesis enzyme MoaA